MPDSDSDVHDAIQPSDGGSSVKFAEDQAAQARKEEEQDIHEEEQSAFDNSPDEQAFSPQPEFLGQASATQEGSAVEESVAEPFEGSESPFEPVFDTPTVEDKQEIDLGGPIDAGPTASDVQQALTEEVVSEPPSGTIETSTADSGVPLFEPIEEDAELSTLSEAESPEVESRTLPEIPAETFALSGFEAPSEPAASFEGPTTSAAAAQVSEEAEAPAGGNASLLVVALFTWASIATILAAWMFKNWPDAPSPLDSLPDDGIKTGKNIISPLEQLSHRELFTIGESKEVGNLRVTPLKIEYRSVDIIDHGKTLSTDPALVLHLRLENISKDQHFHPTDPVYYYPDRRQKLGGFKQFNRRGYTYTFIHPRGSFNDLIFCYNLIYDLNQEIRGQSFARLGPGETEEVVIVSEEIDLKQLKPDMIWRVKLRKGKTKGGKGVATVIGVQFTKDQIQVLTANAA